MQAQYEDDWWSTEVNTPIVVHKQARMQENLRESPFAAALAASTPRLECIVSARNRPEALKVLTSSPSCQAILRGALGGSRAPRISTPGAS
jgi:hypothetical protein